MLRSMDDAVSGLQMHQQWMDVIGNNIANVSTPGFKASDVTFQQLFAQTLSAGSQPQTGLGGTNPEQIGLGVGLGSITQAQTQGALQQTGNSTDLALQGDGYFVLDTGSGGAGYTRVGDFSFDSAGDLVEKTTGFKVQGWLASPAGVLPTPNTSNMTDIVVPQTSTKAPAATANAAFIGNLDSATPSTSNVVVPFTVYDSLGNRWTLNATFTPSGTADQWNWKVTDPSGNAGLAGTTTGTITFTSSGAYSATTGGPFTINPAGTATSSITPNFSAMTQYSSASTANPGAQDGYGSGTLQSISVDKSGVITGTYSNGLTQVLGQVAVATFANPQGLVQQGQDVYVTGNNSGTPVVTPAGAGGAGTIASGSLEGSNVDLAKEFTDMIAAERGFQANARVVTVSDQMLQNLVQLGQ